MDDLATDLACEETLFKETEQWSTAAQRAEHLVHGGSRFFGLTRYYVLTLPH